MTTIFDSAHLVNPLCFAARPFAAGIDLAPAVAPLAWPEYHTLGRNPNTPTDADDPTDFAPRFHPTPADEEWAAQTSPLNRLDDEAAALDALYASIETDREWTECFPDELTGSPWGGHPDRVDLDA